MASTRSRRNVDGSGSRLSDESSRAQPALRPPVLQAQHQPAHLTPQPPQLFLSREVPGMQGHGKHMLCVSTHVPEQHAVPSEHAPPAQLQPPLWQMVPLAQTLPHAPQLLLSLSTASQPFSTLPSQSS